MRLGIAFVLLCNACGTDPPPRTETSLRANAPASDASSVTATEASSDDRDAAVFAASADGALEGIDGIDASVDASQDRTDGARANPRLHPGATAITGRLAPEIIQRIVRQRFRAMKFCYDLGLAKDPTLHGRVSTKFVIDLSGEVSSAESTLQSDMPDMAVVSCVVRSFYALRFPQPQGGAVTVVYPLIFSPGDD